MLLIGHQNCAVLKKGFLSFLYRCVWEGGRGPRALDPQPAATRLPETRRLKVAVKKSKAPRTPRGDGSLRSVGSHSPFSERPRVTLHKSRPAVDGGAAPRGPHRTLPSPQTRPRPPLSEVHGETDGNSPHPAFPVPLSSPGSAPGSE